MSELKIGDKVRFLQDHNSKHPTEDRAILAGDIVEVAIVTEDFFGWEVKGWSNILFGIGYQGATCGDIEIVLPFRVGDKVRFINLPDGWYGAHPVETRSVVNGDVVEIIAIYDDLFTWVAYHGSTQTASINYIEGIANCTCSIQHLLWGGHDKNCALLKPAQTIYDHWDC